MPVLVSLAYVVHLALVATGNLPDPAAASRCTPCLPAIVLPVSHFDPPAGPLALVVPQRPRAVELSGLYYTRLKIHQVASFLTVPLFVAQYVAGRELYTKGGQASQWARDWHGPLAVGIAGLFAVNTVTGVWNLYEGRQVSQGRARRLVHGVLMLVADAGFVAVGATAPEIEEDGPQGGEGNAALHQGLAIGSMSVALVSYLMMFLWKD